MDGRPITELDDRFSDAGVPPATWEDVRRELGDAQLFWIVTVRTDGRPHMTPLVAVWLDDTIYFCTGSDEQKAVNLGRNRHVLLSTGCNEWQGGVDVVIEGDAEPVTDRATLEVLADAWARKWDGSWRFAVTDNGFQHDGGAGTALVFSVKPTKVLAFGKSPFSHTRFRF